MSSPEEMEEMHKEIESLYKYALDHIHADILHRFIDEQQAEIDRLMMEYCPEEMTEEQIDNFERHQKISDLKLD